jgi:hypothetical protein
MPISSSYTNPTGKRNALASFKAWLVAQAPTAGNADFVYAFLSDVSNPETFTRVGVSELQYFQPGNSAFGMNVFPASAYPVAAPAKHGTLQTMLLQIEIKADASVDVDALRKVYKIRDRIRAAIEQAGVANDETGVVAVDACEIQDFENAQALTGIILRCPLEQENAIQEIYIPPDANAPSIHTLRLLMRLEWYELN